MYYYKDWQIVETRDGSGNLAMQVYHGTRYIDEVVGLRIADLGRVYLHQDNNYNVTAMTDLTGRVLERYYYSPYGQLEVAVDGHPFDYDDNGVVDDQDLAAATTGGACWGSYSDDCRRLDADADRVIDGEDCAVIDSFIAVLDPDSEVQRLPAGSRSQLGNRLGYQGLFLDDEIGSYQNRARQYAGKLNRYMQRDPLALGLLGSTPLWYDGNNVAYAENNPLFWNDPQGLSPCTDNCQPECGREAFCRCILGCRQGACMSGLIDCGADFGIELGKNEAKCALGCIPAWYVGLVGYKACLTACSAIGTVGVLIGTNQCLSTFAACGKSANSAYENCVN